MYRTPLTLREGQRAPGDAGIRPRTQSCETAAARSHAWLPWEGSTSIATTCCIYTTEAQCNSKSWEPHFNAFVAPTEMLDPIQYRKMNHYKIHPKKSLLVSNNRHLAQVCPNLNLLVIGFHMRSSLNPESGIPTPLLASTNTTVVVRSKTEWEEYNHILLHLEEILSWITSEMYIKVGLGHMD